MLLFLDRGLFVFESKNTTSLFCGARDTHTRTGMFVHLHTYVYIHVRVCMYVCVDTHTRHFETLLY